VRTANAERVCRSKLTGSFNRYNIAAMCAAAQALAIGPDTVQAALDELESVPGRIERVCVPAGYAVAVDYAHTPDALDKVLETARALTRGRLLCVFGCGGDRDRTKRPLMAAAVARGCDEAIITSDNPRTEKPGAIIEETRQGMPLDFPYRVIEDRRAAIRAAMTMARDGDCVIVAGKGHEDYQEIMGVRHHFDDRETVREIYAELAVRHD